MNEHLSGFHGSSIDMEESEQGRVNKLWINFILCPIPA